MPSVRLHQAECKDMVAYKCCVTHSQYCVLQLEAAFKNANVYISTKISISVIRIAISEHHNGDVKTEIGALLARGRSSLALPTNKHSRLLLLLSVT